MEMRIIDLELKFMEQQRLLEEMSSVLFAQQRLVDGLAQRVERLEGRLRDLGDAIPNEPPPHY